MKKLVFALALSILFTLGLSAAPEPQADTQPQTVENPANVEPESVAAPAESAEPLMCAAQGFTFPGPNYCGDPCSDNGAMVGCIDTSGPVWVRTICTCSNGTLVC